MSGFPTFVLQAQTASPLTDVLNVAGAGMLLAYGFAHVQRKRAQVTSVKRTWRERSTAILAGFLFYALLVATWGPSGTWVATVGTTVDTQLREFATGLALVGEQPQSAGPLDQALATVRTIGLVAYLAVFTAISFSNAAIARIASLVKSIP
jgi:hypothetical protein